MHTISTNHPDSLHFNDNRNYSPEVRKIQRRETELNITLSKVNSFDITQKVAWNICLIIYPKHQTKSE